MGTEVATYISQLNAAWPVGGVDNYSTADDHLRTLKTVLQTQFPNLGAVAVTRTAAQLNAVDITVSLQASLDGKEAIANKNANNGYAGLNASAQLLDARVQASNVTQHQGSLALAASQLTSGTIPDARFPATLPALSGANLTALNAGQITTGSMSDSRIPLSNVSQHQASLSIAASQLTGTLADARVQASNVTQHQGSLAIAATQVTSGVLADGRVQQSNVTQYQSALAINDTQVATSATSSATSFSLSSSNRNRLHIQTGAGTITINDSHGFSANETVVVMRDTSGAVQFAAGGSQTLKAPGSRLGIAEQNGSASATYLGSNQWMISGT